MDRMTGRLHTLQRDWLASKKKRFNIPPIDLASRR